MAKKLSRKELETLAKKFNIPRMKYMNMHDLCLKLNQFGLKEDQFGNPLDCQIYIPKSKKKSPIKSPTKSSTKSPTRSSTKSPTRSSTKSPRKSPRKSPAKSPSKINFENNEQLLIELQKLVKQKRYEISQEKDSKTKKVLEIRLRKVNDLIKIITTYPYKITSGKQLSHIQGVGKKLTARIDEILSKGKLSDVTMTEEDIKSLKQIENLKKVFGVGDELARKLIAQGITTVSQLKKAYNDGKIKLNHKVELGLKYYSNKSIKIPRQEIDTIDGLLNEIVPKINKDLKHVICGSYRRGKLESSDIDILIYHPNIITSEDINQNRNYLKDIIKELKKLNFIVDDILPKFNILYEGYCKFDDHPVRRIDMKYIPMINFYPALLQFTGPALFNANLSLVAIKKGYKLSGNGLFKVDQKSGLEKFIYVNSEAEIFEKLGLKYIKPEDRDEYFSKKNLIL